MAKIEFDGFVEEVLEGRNGPYGLKVSEPHRRKNDQDEWVTTARTFHRVTGAYQSGIQWHTFGPGDRVHVDGKQVTDPYTDREGVKHYPLVVKADTVQPLGGGTTGRSQSQAPTGTTWDAAGAQTGWGGVDDGDTPF